MGKILLLIIGISAFIVLILLFSFVFFAGIVSSSDTDSGQNNMTSRINQTDAVDIRDLEPQVNVTKN